MNRFCSAIALLAAMALAAVGFLRGTYAAGGSDSSCYALMADAFASGTLQPTSALAADVPWPDASKTFAPGGFLPSQSNPAASAPVCAPGFSLLLAPLLKLGGPIAMFAATPIAGAVLVWLAFVAGSALYSPLAGVLAAVLTASSPIVLFQVVQPMNDITTAMLWMAMFVALLSERWTLAGVCCGLALLVRPNLLPLAAVAGIYVVAARDWHLRARRFLVGAVPFVAMILWLNHSLYGGPFRSGYGQVGNLFSLTNVPGNTIRYGRWLIQTQTVVVFAALLAPLAVGRNRRARVWLAFGLVAATAVVYLAYTPFDDWSYLRFFLPALVLTIVLASTVMAMLASFSGPWMGEGSWMGCLAAALLAAGLAFHGVAVARDRMAFVMTALEQRYRSAGSVVRDRLPPGAVVFSTWDSGAVRFHGRKEAIVWDALDPAWLDRAIAWLSGHGRQPFILVESWEEPRFRARFGGSSPVGNLDWPPKFEIDRVVRVYDPADRPRFLRGERVTTEYLWPLRK